MAKKLYEESYIAKIAQKIRSIVGGDKTYKTAEMPDGIDEVYEAGKQAEYDAFWDAYQQNGNRANYEQAFKSAYWTDANFKPKYNIKPKGTFASQIFYQSGVTDLKEICERQGITLDFSQANYASQPFFQSALTRLPICNISGIDNLSTFFHTVKNLVWVDKVILREDGTQIFGNGTGYNWTLYSTNIVHMPIEGTIGTNFYIGSDKLDDETIQSIIDALADLTGKPSQVVSLHAKVVLKLTEEQLLTINNKNWTL